MTFRLHDSLPANRVFPPAQLTTGQAFVALDRLLDNATTGPLYLKQPEIAALVATAIQEGDRHFHRYDLHAYVVMSNHVHLLVTPHVVATKWLGPLKGFTSYEANKILHRSGKRFWQVESYDHLVRNADEFQRIRAYIENNPVKASLAVEPQQFPWSSATRSRLKGRLQPKLADPTASNT